MRKLKFSDAGGHTAKPPTIAGTSIGKIQGSVLADAEFIRLPRPRERCPLSGFVTNHAYRAARYGKN